MKKVVAQCDQGPRKVSLTIGTSTGSIKVRLLAGIQDTTKNARFHVEKQEAKLLTSTGSGGVRNFLGDFPQLFVRVAKSQKALRLCTLAKLLMSIGYVQGAKVNGMIHLISIKP